MQTLRLAGNMQLVQSAGKSVIAHAQPIFSAGKQSCTLPTTAKRGKTCKRCEMREVNVAAATGSEITFSWLAREQDNNQNAQST